MTGLHIWRLGVATPDESWEDMRHVQGLTRYFWVDSLPMDNAAAQELAADVRDAGFKVLSVRRGASCN